MLVLAAKVAPQRSTQYAALASALARSELCLSPLAPALGALRTAHLAGHEYLLLDLTTELSVKQEIALGEMGATSEFFWFYPELGGQPGPFLKPLDLQRPARLPPELLEARRYRGKTNELFTQVLVNLARWAHPGTPTRLLDPLMGGGTTLFVALSLGLHAFGIERERPDVESTDTFLQRFFKESRIRFQRKAERVQGGRRTLFTITPTTTSPPALMAVLINGDTSEAPTLMTHLPGGAKVDLIVADLPYNIQHPGHIEQLLRQALPAWQQVAAPQAILALAWDATRITREMMLRWVSAGSGWQPFQGGCWEALAHPVDRVIKRRDVVVARLGAAPGVD